MVRLVAESGLLLLRLDLRLWHLQMLLGLSLRMCVFLLAENLQLQKELLLLEETGIGGVHGRWRFLCLLVRRNVLVILKLLHFRLHILGLLVTVLV